jgi:ubiquinol-cytochrome c reductase cytochrome b subunit
LAAQTPILGPYLSNLLGAADGIGVLTFSRFYTFHTLLLPLLMVFMIAVHVYLVRRHGVTPSARELRRKQKFYPAQAYRDTVAIFVAFLVLFFMAALVNAPLEAIANPNDASYVPRPEWYFLFLFQALKYFHGALEPVGSIGLPTAAILALLAVPFIDRKCARRLSQRTIAIGLAVLAIAGWGALTARAIASTPKAVSTRSISEVTAQTWTQFPVEEIAAVGYFRKERCAVCHNLGAGEPKPGPNLNGARVHHSTEWIAQHLSSRGQPQEKNSSPNLSVMEMNALSLLASKLTPEKAVILESTPSQLTEGAETYLASGCGGCHKVNGVGGNAGPPLNGIASRRSKDWVKKHFLSPSALSPGSIMPPYQFSSSEQAAIITYLFSLPD